MFSKQVGAEIETRNIKFGVNEEQQSLKITLVRERKTKVNIK